MALEVRKDLSQRRARAGLYSGKQMLK
jgi:hypothetical protein